MKTNKDNPLHQQLTHYCANFCEENIWHLAKEKKGHYESVKVIFISNLSNQVALWQQRNAIQDPATEHSNQPVIWDYHVILATCENNHWQIWDPDSCLASPITASEYLQKTFLFIPDEHAQYRPLFRLLDASSYLRHFSSDRRHMISANHDWLSPPPKWPLITNHQKERHNLVKFTDMNEKTYGDVFNLEQLTTQLSTDQ